MQRFIRFIMLRSFYDIPLIKRFLKLMNAIPIDPKAGHESVANTLNRAREQLQNNHVVCIFPEGKVTRDGKMNEFRPGFETIMEGLDCPIIPIYMHNVWGSIFSFEGAKILKKWPKKIPYPVTIYYGKPLASNTKAAEVEAVVKEMAEGVK